MKPIPAPDLPAWAQRPMTEDVLNVAAIEIYEDHNQPCLCDACLTWRRLTGAVDAICALNKALAAEKARADDLVTKFEACCANLGRNSKRMVAAEAACAAMWSALRERDELAALLAEVRKLLSAMLS